MTDFPDPRLKWYEVFNDGETRIDAAEMGPWCLLSINLRQSTKERTLTLIPGVRIEPMTGDMDRARLVMRER